MKWYNEIDCCELNILFISTDNTYNNKVNREKSSILTSVVTKTDFCYADFVKAKILIDRSVNRFCFNFVSGDFSLLYCDSL